MESSELGQLMRAYAAEEVNRTLRRLSWLLGAYIVTAALIVLLVAKIT